jgi:cell division protein FtsN
MYDLFGAPGFLGAYNCGPGCYADYVAGKRRLPGETRNYIAAISPSLRGNDPGRTAVAAIQVPVQVVSVPVTVTPVAVAPITPPPGRDMSVVSVAIPAPVLDASPVPAAGITIAQIPDQAAVAATSAQPHPVGERKPISAAKSSAPPNQPVAATGTWGVQVGAFRSPEDSRKAVDNTRRRASDLLAGTRMQIAPISAGEETLYRAQIIGIAEAEATEVCKRLTSAGQPCIRVSG